eukprot:gene4991-899_t
MQCALSRIKEVAIGTNWTEGPIASLLAIFVGCCANNITLELVTSNAPHAGKFLTFFQFVWIALENLFFLSCGWTSGRPHLLPLRFHRKDLLLMVALFWAVNTLNNQAFEYKIEIPLHNLFRCSYVVTSLALDAIVRRKPYSMGQVVGVLGVAGGVYLVSSLEHQSRLEPSCAAALCSSAATVVEPDVSFSQYNTTRNSEWLTGILVMSAAVILTSCLGLVQEMAVTNAADSGPVVPPSF